MTLPRPPYLSEPWLLVCKVGEGTPGAPRGGWPGPLFPPLPLGTHRPADGGGGCAGAQGLGRTWKHTRWFGTPGGRGVSRRGRGNVLQPRGAECWSVCPEY